MIRTTLLILALATVCSASAQQGQRTYFFESTEESLEPSAYKLLLVAITQVDPNGMVSIDGTHVKVAFSSRLEVSLLIAAMDHAGAGHFTQRFGHEKSGDPNALEGRPVYNDTGNPEADLVAYDLAKAAWKAAYSELYENSSNDLPR